MVAHHVGRTADFALTFRSIKNPVQRKGVYNLKTCRVPRRRRGTLQNFMIQEIDNACGGCRGTPAFFLNERNVGVPLEMCRGKMYEEKARSLELTLVTLQNAKPLGLMSTLGEKMGERRAADKGTAE